MKRREQRLLESSSLNIYIDGASRGNPGDAGAGVRITDDRGNRIVEMSRYLGQKTNNEAEYWALLLGLEEAKRLGGRSIRIFTDSELVERQINGLYRVRNSNLKLLHGAALRRLDEFSSHVVQSIPREQNQEADRLANEAVDKERTMKEKGGSRKGTVGRSP